MIKIKKMLAVCVILIMTIQMISVCAVSATGNFMRFRENFTKYNQTDLLNGLGGWTVANTGTGGTGTMNATIAADPNNATNNVAQLYDYIGGQAGFLNLAATLNFSKMSGTDSNGIVTVQYKYAQGAISKNSRVTLRDGTKALCYLYVDPGVNCGWNLFTADTAGGTSVKTNLSWGSVNSDGTYLLKNAWQTIKFVFNFNTESVTVYTNGSSTAKVTSKFITAGCTGIDNIIATTANDSNALLYFDDFYAVDGTDITIADFDEYAITSASYVPNGDKFDVTAKAIVPSTFTSAVVIAAAYDDTGKLVAMGSTPYTKEGIAGSWINFEKSLDPLGANVATVKVLLWDSLIGVQPYCAGLNASLPTPTPSISPSPSPSPTPTPTPSPIIDNDLSDLQIPAFVPASVTRLNVPVEVTPGPSATPDPLVYMTYPEGRLKAAVMSFDDGWAQDMDIVLPVLRQYGLKSAFNLVLGPNTSNSFMGHDATGKTVFVGPNTTQGYKDFVNTAYAGFEIASHGSKHLSDYNLSKDHYRQEVGDSKNITEMMFNKEVGGYVRAGGNNGPDPILAGGTWRSAYLKYVGYRYLRNAPGKVPYWATTGAMLNFDIPSNFFNWDPALNITDPGGTKVTAVDAINGLLSIDPNNTMKVFFGWGHPWSLGSEPYPTYVLTTNAGYPLFTEYCRILSENLDKIWNPNPIELVDYVNATRQMQITKDGDAITVYNASAAITVWVNIKGINTPIAPGETITR